MPAADNGLTRESLVKLVAGQTEWSDEQKPMLVDLISTCFAKVEPANRTKLLAVFLAMGPEKMAEFHAATGHVLDALDNGTKVDPVKARVSLAGVTPEARMGEARALLHRHGGGRPGRTAAAARSIAPTRSRSRQSHRARPGHRRVVSARAGPKQPGDDGPAEPGSEPKGSEPAPSTRVDGVYTFGCEACEACGHVLIWHEGRLKCCWKPCPFWGRPA